MKRPALFQQQKQRCQLTLSSQFSLHHISICKGQGQAWWGFLFRESSLQIKWDSFIVKEGRGKKERKSCRIYLMEKSCFSGGGSSADTTSWRLGASCACAPLSHPINCVQNDLGFTLSLHFIQLGLPCLSPWEGQGLTHHDVDSGIPQSPQWSRDGQLHPRTRTCDG